MWNLDSSGNALCQHLPQGMYTKLSDINFKLVEVVTKSKAARRDCKKDGANLPIIKSEADLALASFLAGKLQWCRRFDASDFKSFSLASAYIDQISYGWTLLILQAF